MMMQQHCIPCVLRRKAVCNQISNMHSPPHDYSCYNTSCIRCLGQGHNCYNYRAVVVPSTTAGRRGCRWWFLEVLLGRVIHGGHNRPNIEYGSKETCPFQHSVSFALGMWTNERWRAKIYWKEYLRLSSENVKNEQYYYNWLTVESTTGSALIICIDKCNGKTFSQWVYDGEPPLILKHIVAHHRCLRNI